MSNEFYILVLAVIAITFVVNFCDRSNKVEEVVIENDRLTYDEIFEVITETIKVVFKHKYEMEYKLKDIKMFYNFEDEVRELTTEVIKAFSDDFIKKAEFYHTGDYIATYITRSITVLLIEYTKANKVKTK